MAHLAEAPLTSTACGPEGDRRNAEVAAGGDGPGRQTGELALKGR
jgi:hypothetical protein